MPDYAFLLLPSANRVYAEAAPALALGELGVFNGRLLGGRLRDLAEERIAGVPYLRFSAPDLELREVEALSMLSSIYALFERVEGPGHESEGRRQPARPGLLLPVELRPLARFDDDLLTIHKYPGKTNEQFTRLLLNVTVASTAFAAELPSRKLRILDPVCGRGTTLNQALMYGWDCGGVEIDEKDVAAYEQFLGTWLKRKRLKHSLRGGAVREKGKIVGRRFDVEIGATKEEYDKGQALQLTVVGADTTRAREHFKGASFDAIVADLPYGVQHGSHGGPALSRRPSELLAEALPGWTALLKPGGALGLAWNRHVAGREKVAELLSAAGLQVQESPPYLAFRHAVDQSIDRDLIVALKA